MRYRLSQIEATDLSDLWFSSDENSPYPVRVGDYILLEQIACGGMAEVHRAFSLKPTRDMPTQVALKCLRSDLVDEEKLGMIVDEARIAGELRHENIARVFDSGRMGESYFIAMEYINGVNLHSMASHLRKANLLLPLPHALHIASLVARALHAAHTQRDPVGRPMQIVHRDVSPQNVVISFDGKVKLIDFGVAKACDRITCTRVGVLKGKLAYMSPEQILGEAVDFRSDIFSLGLTLFLVLTGRLPYGRLSDLKVLKTLSLGEMQRVRSVNPRLPQAVDDIVSKCLAQDPSDRFADAQELEVALRSAIAELRPRYNNASLASYMTAAFNDLRTVPKAAQPTPTFGSVDLNNLVASTLPAKRDPGIARLGLADTLPDVNQLCQETPVVYSPPEEALLEAETEVREFEEYPFDEAEAFSDAATEVYEPDMWQRDDAMPLSDVGTEVLKLDVVTEVEIDSTPTDLTDQFVSAIYQPPQMVPYRSPRNVAGLTFAATAVAFLILMLVASLML